MRSDLGKLNEIVLVQFKISIQGQLKNKIHMYYIYFNNEETKYPKVIQDKFIFTENIKEKLRMAKGPPQ